MSKDDSLRDLIERVEAYNPKLSLDNRADEMPLDLAIAQAVGIAGPDWQAARGSVTGYFSGDGVGGFGNPRVLPYTRSVDAAMTLVPDGWRRWMLDADNGDGLCQLEHEETDREVHSRGKTWPLALCAASLKARMGTGG